MSNLSLEGNKIVRSSIEPSLKYKFGLFLYRSFLLSTVKYFSYAA